MGKIKPFFKTQHFNISGFKQSTCLTTISVGQQTHEGERFSATIDLLNNSFQSCVMLIDDTLQRHTMALNAMEDAAFFYEKSLKEGDLWLERNEKYYKKLSILTKIIRWDTWLNHPNFLTQKKKIEDAIHDDIVYRQAFENSIEIFLTKYYSRLLNPENFDMERARKLSFNFVLEECTALCLWPELQCQFEVYPNRHNAAIEETRMRFVLSKHPDLLHPITIGFRNSKQIKPQHFELLQYAG